MRDSFYIVVLNFSSSAIVHFLFAQKTNQKRAPKPSKADSKTLALQVFASSAKPNANFSLFVPKSSLLIPQRHHRILHCSGCNLKDYRKYSCNYQHRCRQQQYPCSDVNKIIPDAVEQHYRHVVSSGTSKY